MATFWFISCEKSKGSGELGFNQVIDRWTGVDSLKLPVITYTQNVDSVQVAFPYSEQVVLLGGYRGNRLVGRYIDPDFGEVKASIVTQMVLSHLNANFGNSPVVDSVKLLLQYSGYYGDTSKPISLEVFELSEQLADDNSYYSSYIPQLGAKIGELNDFIPKPHSYIKLDEEIVSPLLVIPLDVNYFQQNFANVGDGSFSGFSSNNDFIGYFKGIHISAKDNSEGSILYLSLESSLSKAIIYFHNATDTLTYGITFSQSLSRIPIGFSIFSQDYTNAIFDLQNQDKVEGESTTYIQSMGGVSTVISIPDLDTISNKGWMINKAFLDLYTQKGAQNGLAPNKELEVREIKETRSIGKRILDFTNGREPGNGIIKPGDSRGSKYTFDLSRFVFSVANGKERESLVIVPISFSTTANRTILQGPNNPDVPIQLIIYYTKP